MATGDRDIGGVVGGEIVLGCDLERRFDQLGIDGDDAIAAAGGDRSVQIDGALARLLRLTPRTFATS